MMQVTYEIYLPHSNLGLLYGLDDIAPHLSPGMFYKTKVQDKSTFQFKRFRSGKKFYARSSIYRIFFDIYGAIFTEEIVRKRFVRGSISKLLMEVLLDIECLECTSTLYE
jgi:hypothetical protein